MQEEKFDKNARGLPGLGAGPFREKPCHGDEKYFFTREMGCGRKNHARIIERENRFVKMDLKQPKDGR